VWTGLPGRIDPVRNKEGLPMPRSSEANAREGPAILAALGDLAPDSPTACAAWTAHHLAAHLAAGAKEVADLVHERLDGRPERPTRGFEEREVPFRAMRHDKLLERLVVENKRKLTGYDALAREKAPNISFTGVRMTIDELAMHSRSEAAIHRWDLVGDDQISDELLAQPELTAHAVKILDAMPILNESATAMGDRAEQIGAEPLRVVFRSPPAQDVVFVASPGGGRFEFAQEHDAECDVVLSMDPGQRLLALWGRKSSERPIRAEGDPEVIAGLDAVFWPHAQDWPSTG
jgi:uncharacterized protein (TIGR03083 family)